MKRRKKRKKSEMLSIALKEKSWKFITSLLNNIWLLETRITIKKKIRKDKLWYISVRDFKPSAFLVLHRRESSYVHQFYNRVCKPSLIMNLVGAVHYHSVFFFCFVCFMFMLSFSFFFFFSFCFVFFCFFLSFITLAIVCFFFFCKMFAYHTQDQNSFAFNNNNNNDYYYY